MNLLFQYFPCHHPSKLENDILETTASESGLETLYIQHVLYVFNPR